jgi:Concanavalin A-like lectin/glucanases superfamily/Ig-like domain CHU_C associated/PKD-like domain/Protein of unknown function (DUF1573)/Secretion system C-terminal sorting domain
MKIFNRFKMQEGSRFKNKNTYIKIVGIVLLLHFCTSSIAQTQTYTATGASKFSVPDGVSSITVEAWGGGGRGAARPGTPNSRAGGGGGGGAYARSVIAVTAGTTYNLSVGAGSTNTASGGSSTFNTTSVIALGGGSHANNTNNSGIGGSGPLSTGDIKFSGGFGAVGTDATFGGGGGSSGGNAAAGNFTSAGTNQQAGAAAPSGGFAGGTGANTSTAGITGGIGAGGGGGYRNASGTVLAPGNGGNGQIMISWSCSGVNLSNLSLSANSSSCRFSGATVTVNSSTLANGTYTVYYSVSGTNTIANTTATMVFASGTGTFTTAVLNTTGASTIKLNSIGCGYIHTANTVNTTVVASTATVNNGGGTAAAISKGGNTLALNGSFGGTATGAVWSDSIGGTFVNNSGSTPSTTIYTPPAGYTGTTALTLTSVGPGCPATTTKNLTVTEVIFTVAPTPICRNTQQTYTVTPLSGTTYTWSLPPGWVTVGNVTNNSINVIPSSNSGTITVTPSNASGSGASVSVPIMVTTTANYISAAISGSRNGAGSVLLSATATAGTINWFTVASGGTSQGTGTTFNTPSISSTTTFYVETNDGCPSPRIPIVARVLAPEIYLTGNGNAIADGDSTPSYVDDSNFGETTAGVPIVKTFAISNSGTLPLTISGVSVAGGSFSVSAPAVPFDIPAGGFSNFTVTFSSASLGTQNTTLTITNNDSDEATYDVAIQASVIAATTTAEIEVIANGTLIPDSSTLADINTVNFTQFGNNFTGVAMIKTYTIRNSGVLPLTITSANSSNATDFAIAPISTTIAAGGSYNFTITFNTATAGVKTTVISIINSDSDEGTYNFELAGTGIVAGQTQDIQIVGNNVNIQNQSAVTLLANYTNLGSTFVASPITKTYVIKNLGLDNLSISSWLIAGQNASDFIISAISSPITGGNQTTFTITFTPTSIGAKYATVTIVNTTPGRVNYTFAIEGLGITTITNPTLKLEGNLIPISNGDITPTMADGTDFGGIQINSEKFRTFTIQNIGTNPLNLTGNPKVTISGPGSADYSVTLQPASTINGLEETTFTIRFNPLNTNAPALRLATVSIASNDPTANPFTFDIIGTSIQTFFDSDNDGVYDNLDVDDDNDGIRDTTEEGNCNLALADTRVNYKFLYETFGSGARTTINTTYPATTNYIYQDATTPTAGDNGVVTTSLIDGKYTVGSSAQIAEFSPQFWYKGTDHTGDLNGRMAIFNASFYPGVFYEAEVTGALPNVPVTYSFWVLNIDRTDANNVGTRKRPNIRIEFRDTSNTLLQSIITGPIMPTTAGNLAGDWQNFTSELTFPVGTFRVLFINNESGGAGNDLAIDDILITQSLCDRDSDGVADVFDLDADNDGIPDVVEAGLGNTTNGKAKIDIAWLDANGNGLHDSAESVSALPALDSDGDGIPNFIDLDSDNDSLFDVDESGTGNSSVGVPTGYVNGDGDITGDGRGDGPESEEFRSKDSNGDGINELYGDGILDIYDFGTGATFNDKYGNFNQGTASGNAATTYLQDTDSDGIPDYLDRMSNGTTFDIANTLKIYDYKILDANNNGAIDGTADADKDGILDAFDTSFSPAYFGSPRDIRTKLFLDFDGRNDYGQCSSILGGLSQASLMAWIDLDPNFNSEGVIVGQDKFQIRITSSRQLQAVVNGTTTTYSTALQVSRWYNIGATYDGAVLKLFLNGVLVQNQAASGSIGSDSSPLTLGKNPTASNKFFKGKMDEVRVFNSALTDLQLQRMVYQEIKDFNSEIRGEIVPKNIDNIQDALPFSSLLRYYRMDNYKDDVIDDLTSPTIDVAGTKIYNHKNIYVQQAPMPFITERTGNFQTAVNSPANDIHGADIMDNDYSIVQVKHNISETSNAVDLGMFVDPTVTIVMNNDSKIQNDWYLKLDGKIDLVGKSQLVQTAESDLDPTSAGFIERDQQGQSSIYNYNYWSSPVSPINNTTNNTNYSVAGVMKDGNQSIPRDIEWIGGYDGSPATATTAVKLARYWLYKFESNAGNYSNWIQFNETDQLRVGQGYTLKGSGDFANFTFVGKPNSGLINTNVVGAADLLLVGNPYPSALNADQFINDNIINKGTGNGSSTDGTLYFWEHAPDNNSHILAEYRGGYSVYNLTGGLPPISADYINGVGQSSKIPGQYIPVGQSFFVYGNETGGPVIFNNGQRAFKKETDSDSNGLLKIRGNTNTKETAIQKEIQPSYKKLRLGFDASNKLHRQVLLGFMDDKATSDIDPGYDASGLDDFSTDMYFLKNDTELVIQGEGKFDELISYPIGVKTDKECKITFMIDAIENFSPDQTIYIYDAETNLFHNLVTTKFETTLAVGTNNTRFSLHFNIEENSKEKLSITENSTKNSSILLSLAQNSKILTINNQMDDAVEQVTLVNMSGQIVSKYQIENQDQKNIQIQIQEVRSGIYITRLKTKNGEISKKIIVN